MRLFKYSYFNVQLMFQESFDAAKGTPSLDDAAIGDMLHPAEVSTAHWEILSSRERFVIRCI
jgi:hypothetical protein